MSKLTPILFTIPNFITAGSGRAMLNIIERLDRSKFAPAVCVMKKGGDLDKEVERLGIPFIEAPPTIAAKPYVTFFFRAWKASRVFKPYRFRLWHSFHYSDDYTEAIIAKLSGAQWIYTKKNMNWHRRSWYIRTFFAKRVAAQNKYMMNQFFNGIFREKTQLIPRGVDLNRFQPHILQERPLRKSLDIPESAIAAGCVAHLVPVKGHPTFLEAASKVLDLHLVLAGRQDDQSYFMQLKKLAEKLRMKERVHFLGDFKEISAFWAQMDISVLPTWAKWRQEGCPVALLEEIG